jgi:hypothetical protein
MVSSTDPVSLELKDGAKPYSCKPYPVPRLHKDLLKEKYKDCVILEFLNGSPSWNGLHHHLYYQNMIRLSDFLVILGK